MNKPKLKPAELPLKKRERLFEGELAKLVEKYKISLDIGHKIVMVNIAPKPTN